MIGTSPRPVDQSGGFVAAVGVVNCDYGLTSWEVLSSALAGFKQKDIDLAKQHARKALQILEELQS